MKTTKTAAAATTPELIEKALYGQMTPAELDSLWDVANKAMHAGKYGEAFGATEGLLTQADAGRVVADCLPDVRLTRCAEGRTAEMIQGFVDRVESLNWHVQRRH